MVVPWNDKYLWYGSLEPRVWHQWMDGTWCPRSRAFKGNGRWDPAEDKAASATSSSSEVKPSGDFWT